MRHPPSRRAVLVVRCLLVVLACSAAGCTWFGVLAGKVVPPPTIPAQYSGFANQSIAVMVWAGEGTMIDFPDVRTDIAGSLQKKLKDAQDAKAKEFANVTFPTAVGAIVRLQENHPEYEAMPLTKVAPKLGASRVVYVELENLQTRSDASVELYRGSASASVKVVEVPADGAGEARIAFQESAIAAVFPPNAREEGSPNGNDFTIYRGVVDALTSEIAKRFVPHQEEQ